MDYKGKNKGVEGELKYLASGELMAVVLFWIVYILYLRSIDNASSNFIIFSMYPLFLLSIILLQGSFYWYNCLKRVQKKEYISRAIIGKIYYKLKRFNWILIIVYIPVFILFSGGISPLVAVIFALLYIFAIIEQLNYFHIRLSYESKVFGAFAFQIIKPIKQIITGTTRKSQIAKDILLYLRN
ncbi:MAG: hypothetical protein ACRC3H_06585 [Lachnospiraceae bacterium]